MSDVSSIDTTLRCGRSVALPPMVMDERVLHQVASMFCQVSLSEKCEQLTLHY